MSDQNDVLYHLIDVCEDAKAFYESAAEKAEDPYIETVFKNMAYIRSSIIVDLSRFVKANGGDPEKSGTIPGKTAQFFGELVAHIKPDTDKTLVTHLEEAEDRALKEFHDAMAQNIPLQTKAVLSQQLGTLQETHDYMKALKDRLQ